MTEAIKSGGQNDAGHSKPEAKAQARERAEIWLRENAAALESSNAWVEENGLPLDQYRQF
ncbi:Post-segregation antitoxin (ccd killing mechanism protein) encoded by the F plasmid [Pannonibacter phragmitetus]|uniref:Post-segregation antitoxin (Ccd killing mechanism protein) encoded by the F plasmid n=1 Tax=Pannonibacter phragmitetus TaxID=121719 RepID=A0A379HL74_9HYPH|nr:type II toxin-antitoxin system CcdA family antitoxin [Pannonibacter phragmitetus]SUC82672.1 Post-segregation antitoxin (ccd killing mechanism protein) encoded by the F plasmid [Pannonibacter phragmitetus]